MNQLSLLPLESDASSKAQRSEERRTTGRRRIAPTTAVGAPGYISVRAAAERLGLRPRSVLWLIQRGRLRSERLGRIHFLPTALVEAYRRERARRKRRSTLRVRRSRSRGARPLELEL